MRIIDKVIHLWHTIFVPTSIAPIKFVLLLENVLGIYRNTGYYNKKIRRFVYMRAVLEIVYTIACIVAHTILYPPLPTITRILFYMNGVTSIFIIGLAILYRKTFSKLLTIIEDNHIFFANDKEYNRKLLKRDSIIKYIFLILNLSVLVTYILMKDFNKITFKINLVFILCARISDCRCICEHVVIYSILYVTSAQVECITRAVNRKRSELNMKHNKETQLELTEFEDLFTVYSNIKKSSQLFNEIFGRQLILLLASATSYCILFLYNLAFLSVRGFQDLFGLTESIVKLLTFFLPLLLISWSAQQIINNVNHLRCQLGKLLIDCEHDVACYKATKGFLRLVSARSIQTKTLGSIYLDMTLIPSFIMFVTSYTVIALQFNNIL